MTWFVGSTLVLYCSNGCFALPHTMYMYMCMYVTFWGFAFWGSTRSYKVINLFFNTCSGEQLPSVSPQFVCVSHTKICESGNIQRASEPRSLCVCYVHARCVLCAFHERAMCVLCACYVRATCACYMCVLCARSSDRPPDRSPVRPSVPPTVLGWTVAHTLRVSKLSQLEKHLIVSWRVV